MFGALFDGLIGFFRGVLGAPDVRDGEGHVHSFYHNKYPSWDRAKVRSYAPSLKGVPNGHEAATPPTASTAANPK